MRSLGNQFSRIEERAFLAALPEGVLSPPISTRSALCRLSIAVSSARNSGVDRASNFKLLCVISKMFLRAYTVRTGRIDFSTTILSVVGTLEMVRAEGSI